MMRALDLFSAAAGGWSLGLHRAGFLTIAACEIVEWRRILYAENNPHVRIYDDIRGLTAARLVSDLGILPDIIVGSPPCQDISSANTSGKGIDGERSGLYLEAVRLVGDCRPRWFAFENSANLRTRGADRLLDELDALGYAVEPCVVGASDVGANHVRKRSWLIGYDPEQLARTCWNADQQDRTAIGRVCEQSASDDDRGITSCFASDAGIAIPTGWHSPGGRFGRAEGDEGIGPLRAVPKSPAADAGEAEWRAQVERAGDRDGQADERGEGADRHAEPVAPCSDDVADARGVRLWQQRERIGSADAFNAPHDPRHHDRNTPDPDETRQPDGRLESGLRPEEIADDGRGDGRGDDGSRAGQMGGSAGAGSDAAEPWADWNGGLAHHLRLDDGLSAWVADTRIALDSRKGTSAASLIVEAFGDAVLPQIPEAIGRAILRTEAALDAVLARTSIDIPGDKQ